MRPGKQYTLETLRERLREFFVEEGDYEKRAVASMSAVQLITAILEAGPQLEALGLQIRFTNGVAQIFTSKIQNEKLSAFIAERAPVGVGGVGGLQHLEAAPKPSVISPRRVVYENRPKAPPQPVGAIALIAA